MTILVHDSFASLTDADAYHEARATTAWTSAPAPVRSAALIRATDYIRANYFFRANPISESGPDALLVQATVVMAVYALADTLAEKAEREIVEEEKELAGVGRKRVKYAEGRAGDPYPLVTSILAPLIIQTGGGVSTGRLDR